MSHPSSRRRLFAILNVLVLASLLLTQAALPASAAAPTRVQSTGETMPRRGVEAPPSQSIGGSTPTIPQGLDITLSEGSEQPQEAVSRTVTTGEPLSAAETAALLARTSPLPTPASDVLAFRLPAQPVPPPSPENRIDATFPPTASAPLTVEVQGGDLEVLRFAPEGEIRMAPFLQVTFNQPMIALGTLEQVAAAAVPVTITPQLPGEWKWLGTKTLTFEYKGETGDPAVDRFPMATAYAVEIPEGTTSATGGVLQEAVTWSFTTPAPTVRISSPSYGPQSRDPLFFVGFDQLIDPAAVLNTIKVVANGAAVDVRLAAAAEVAADASVTALAKQAGEGRWLAFRATQELPYDATINVNIGPNTPSAEGPLVTQEVQSYSFQTYGALRVIDASCSWGGEVCSLGSPFQLQFTNSIDAEAFDPAWITVAPTIAGMTVNVYGNALQIMGAMAGRTTYEVTVSGAIQDVFGQTLGKDQSFTFKTDQAYPMLTAPYQSLVTMDPAADPTFSVFSRNYARLHLRIYAVTPDDWKGWQSYQSNYWSNDNPPTPPGELVVEKDIAPEGEADALVQTNIDLTQALPASGLGHLIVIVDIPKPLFGDRDRSVVQAWVQVTNLAVDALADQDELLAWSTRLSDGASLSAVTVELYGTKQEGVTGPDGTVKLPLDASNGYMLVATQGDDVSILPRYVWDYYDNQGWTKQAPTDELRWYVFDDRQMYRPGEEVHIKGWLRRFGQTPTGDITLLGDSAPSVRYQVTDPTGNSVADGVLDLSALNGFDFKVTLPENGNLGYYNVYFTANGVGNVNYSDNSYTFQVQEFRRPEFAVTAQPEGKGPWFVGEDALVSVNAGYYAGGPLPGADTTWVVNATPASYSPPNWDEFTFGIWQPWWIFAGDYGMGYGTGYGDVYYGPTDMQQGPAANTLQGVTDATGTHYLRMSFNRADAPRPYTVNAQATVMDVNRQAWSTSTSLLVHPSALYVGLRSNQTFVNAGEPLKFDIIVTDVDGNVVPETSVEMHAARQEYVWKSGQYVQQETDQQDCTVTSAAEPVQCTFTTDVGGTYRIWADVRDANERLNRSEMTRWVSGGTSVPARNLAQEQAQIIPDKQDYKAGDVAELLVQSPFSPAEGLLSVGRNGILVQERFTITDGTAILRVPIEEAYVPNVVVQVDLTGAATRVDDQGNPMPDAPKRPAFASAQLSLPVPPVNRTLALALTPAAAELAPGETTALDVVATDSAGKPVAGAELAVVVVDEAILALTGYTIPDPLLSFYREVGSGIDSTYARNNVVLIDPATMAQAMMGGRGGGGGDAYAAAAAPAAAESMSAMDMAMPAAPAPMATAAPAMAAKQESAQQPSTPIEVRSDFNPLAIFAPAVTTDADGKAHIEFKLPDNLTRYRVTVVAAKEKDFGSAQANITARLPLMVRPSAPRFLNFGDAFEFPVVLQNQTDAPLTVSVAMTTSNIGLDDPLGRSVEVPANDRVELRFPANTQSAGTGRFVVAASAGDYADAVSGELPVYTPATTEAFAVYGTVDAGAVAQPLQTPTGVFPQFGGLEIGTSSTALSALTDAVLYLYKYPFECSEQIASRTLGIASLKDVLTAFQAKGLPDPATLNGVVASDIDRLVQMQNMDGGWPMWQKGRDSLPYNSIFVAQALITARSKDYTVPDAALSSSLNYLRNIETYYPAWYSDITRRTLSAYALYVRDLMGDTDAAKARNLLNAKPLEEQSLEAIGWLWQVLADDPSSSAEVEAIRTHVNNSAVETAGAANFFTSYGDQEWVLLHSNRRTDAILLDAMINDQPQSDLIPKLVKGLLANRTAGRWDNTQENVWVLLALDRYFNTYENVEPDFIARVWLGDTYVAEHPYKGYSTDAYQTLVPMSLLTESKADTQDIIIAKDGDGRLYYRLGLSYAPTDLNLTALDRGFVVARSYEAVDSPADVTRDADGTWHIKAGARVRIRIQMVADNRRYHVALVDPLPAGLEPINPALAVSEAIPEGDPIARPYGWWWYGTWYEHQNLRDSRAEAFTSLLWDGVYQYTYVARATTPGSFVVPPAKAEEMYSPEVFGRSAGDKVIVE